MLMVRLFLLFSALYLSVEALPKITRTGRFLFDPSGNRFYIKGIAYSPPGINPFTDPLADTAGCQRDLPFLQQLGINAIRTYAVNSSLNHDGCMKLFNDNNIYLILDVELPINGSIDIAAPAWTTNLLDQFITTIEVFSKYDNVLAFNVGNEVIKAGDTGIAPYVKAAARDVKAYLNSVGSSTLVGYASIDMSAVRLAVANFLSCDLTGKDDGSTAIDLFGLNDYEWCGNSTFEASYASVTSSLADYNVVAYFSEFGCLRKPPRLWTETAALFGSQMTPVWSGGVAFSYFPSASSDGQFGLVNVTASTVTTGSDFDRLKAEYAKVSFLNTPTKSAAPAATYPACAPPTSDFVAANALPPTPNNSACDCVKSALSCQYNGAETTSTVATIGTLTDQACQFLGQASLNCNDISGNGTTGVYGVVADCDPTIKLSYVMSLYYESQERNAAACSFAGNGTVNSKATVSASAVASSCVANPSAVFAPSGVPTPSQVAQPPSTSTGAGGSSGGNGSGSGTKSGAESQAVYGVGIMVMISLLSAAWTFV